jgi:hypothetical protein
MADGKIKRIAAPTPAAWARVERGIERIEKWRDPNADEMGRQRAIVPVETVFFRNDSDETIPPFGLIRVDDIELVGTDEPLLVAFKPVGTGLNVFANDGQPVPSGGIGSIQLGPLWTVRYDPDERDAQLAIDEDWTPSFGDVYGDQNDSFLASQFGTGLIFHSRVKGPHIGDTTDEEGYANYYLFRPIEQPVMYCKPTGTIAANSSGTVRPYRGGYVDATSPGFTRDPDTKTDRTAFNRAATSVSSTHRCLAVKDETLNRWVIINAFKCT